MTKTVTDQHPDLPISREVPADMEDRYVAAGWLASKPEGADAEKSE